jgi:hypothetical protein
VKANQLLQIQNPENAEPLVQMQNIQNQDDLEDRVQGQSRFKLLLIKAAVTAGGILIPSVTSAILR